MDEKSDFIVDPGDPGSPGMPGLTGTVADFDRAIEHKFPAITWREPLRARSTGGQRGLLCRLCTARLGFKGSDIATLPQTQEEFDRHMEEVHGSE